MDPDEFDRQAAKFFPKAKDWPPHDQRQVITPEEAISDSKKPKKAQPPQNK